MTTPAATSIRKASPARRVARIVGGWTLLAVGAALLVLPGPGLLVIAAGLALLATEYDWAASLLHKVKARLATARQAVGRRRAADSAATSGTRGEN